MSRIKLKSNPAVDRRVEIEAAQLFGKHVSREKGIVLLVLSATACLLPLVLGIRLWDRLPEQFATGFVRYGGVDDPVPRWMVIPGVQLFFLVLNLAVHGQLWFHQKKLTVPPGQLRVVGRWGCPILSIIVSGMMLWSGAGVEAPELFAGLCFLSIVLFVGGSYLWGCPRDAKVALPVWKDPDGHDNWDRVHTTVGKLCLAGGTAALIWAMLLPVA